jgi:hypothetical protein
MPLADAWHFTALFESRARLRARARVVGKPMICSPPSSGHARVCVKVDARGFKRCNRQSESDPPVGNAMALTPEQARKVIELRLKRRMQGFPPLVPAKFTDDPVHEFMQDSANALHEGEAHEGAGEGMDQVDHEAVKSDGLSLTKVKSLLIQRGIPEETVNAMSRAELRAEQANLRARAEPTPEQKVTGVKHATDDEDRLLKNNDASRNLHAKELWRRLQRISPRFAALRRRQRYRYAGVALIGIAIGSLITLSLKPRTTYSDCILSHIDHASSQMAVYVTEHACAAKYPPALGEAAE